MSDSPLRPARAESFEEALAHWQLQVRSALEKASSLPTKMFDACDATLEAQLTAATGGLLRQLLGHDGPPSDAALAAELHLEEVCPDELRRLQREVADLPAAELPDLAEGNHEEHLAILTELEGAGDPARRTGAAQALAPWQPSGPRAAEHGR
jgi:hypothetical protein